MIQPQQPVMFMCLQQQAQQEKLVVLRKHRQRIKSEANWKLFYYQFNRDHSKPNLIWNFKVRTFPTFSVGCLRCLCSDQMLDNDGRRWN